MFLDSAPQYRQVNGLIRKYYLLAQDGSTSGGAYLFRSWEDAERLFNDDWKKYIVTKYGGEASIAYFDTPVIVDNQTGEIVDAR